VRAGSLRLHARGNWTARAECAVLDASMAAPTGPIALVLRRESGAEDTFTGTVRRSPIAATSARLDVAIVGGAGRLLAALDPAGLDFAPGTTPLPAGLVLRRIATAASETLDDGVEEALDAYQIPRWHVAGGMSAAASLDVFVAELARRTGRVFGWRLLPSGRLWVGVETWPTLTHAARALDPDLDDGLVEYAPDGAPLLPGWTIDDRRAVEVDYQVQPGSLRATVRAAVAGDPPHRPDLDLYGRSWPAAVVAQHDDGTLDVRCDDARIGELLSVPLYVGIPGSKVTVPVDPDPTKTARLLVRFEGASPAAAFASALEQDDAAGSPLALVGDHGAGGNLSGVADLITGIVTFTYSSPIVEEAPVIAPSVVLKTVVLGPGHKYVKGVPAT
jgi:hypothetical protein